MLSNQKSSRFYSVKGISFIAIALALVMSVTAFASGDSSFAFIDSATEFLGLQSSSASVTSPAPAANSVTISVPCAAPGESRTVTLPFVSATPGIVQMPITVGDLTNCGVISYDLNVDFTSTILTPAVPAFVQTGTLSQSMSVTPNSGNAGHLIVSAFQGAPLCDGSPGQICSGGETLLILRFNVIGTAGQSSPVTFVNYTDPGAALHPGFVFNEVFRIRAIDSALAALSSRLMASCSPLTPWST